MSGYNKYDEDVDSKLVVDEEAEREYQQVQTELDFNEALIEDRQREIKKIETNMAELNEIFRDLNDIVHDQDVMVNNIVTNLEDAHGDVEAGISELQEAKTVQKKSRYRMCLIIAIIVGFVVLLVVAASIGVSAAM
mmetsp:Transcript_12378/g.34928  ORF Transcript_12378/g.34928 Transcript_12378/m.34928 type:complete len:136 (+) Transcript_12378:451-858(+)